MSKMTSFTEDKQTIARKLLASAMEMDPADVPDDAAIGQQENWDSMAHLRLIAAIEEHIGSPLEAETVVAIASLNDIAGVLEEAEQSSRA